jgi:hypothetical protein
VRATLRGNPELARFSRNKPAARRAYFSTVARLGSKRSTPLLPAICAKRAAATKPRIARTLPTRREYPSIQTSALDAMAHTRACPDVLRSNRWTC